MGDTLATTNLPRAPIWTQLDTLRLILALVVFIAHFCQIFLFSTGMISRAEMDIPSQASRFAVLGFFSISGLVIGKSLLEKSANNPNGFILDFALRRITRIYPPLLFAVVLCVTLLGILTLLELDIYSGTAEVPARPSYTYRLNQVAKAFATFGIEGELTGVLNGPLWSLQHEMKLYVLSGLLFWAFFATRMSIKLFATAAAVALLLRIAPHLTSEIGLCYIAFASGLALNFIPAHRMPHTLFLPAVRYDFSYSLFILHFPIMLFFFFLIQHRPNQLAFAAILSAALAIAVSFWSSLLFENRARLKALVNYMLKSRIQALNARGVLIRPEKQE